MASMCFLVTTSVKTFIVIPYPVFEHSDTLLFALLACIILCINDKQFKCSFTFVQYIFNGLSQVFFCIRPAEMPTLIVALQEYERHFSIWGHFQEYQIFHQKNVMLQNALTQDKLQYLLAWYPHPPSQKHS